MGRTQIDKRRRYRVIDLECAPDPRVVAILGRKPGCVAAIMRIDAVALFDAVELEDGNWGEIRLWSAESDDEFDLLMALDEAIGETQSGDTLVTYAGRDHDLPLIARRAARHWIFGLPGLDAIRSVEHRDIMLSMRWSRGVRRPSLRDACAALGIRLDHLVQPSTPGKASKRRKAEVDVIGTYLLLLHELAIERRDEKPLGTGWAALGDLARSAPWTEPHLAPLLRHEMLDAWRGSTRSA